MAKGTLLGGVIVIGILFAACSPGGGDVTPAAAPAAPSTSPSYSFTPTLEPSAVPAAASAFAGEAVTVTEVIDGDTFRTSDNREIRVLGIDSCEKGTYGGGLATADAEQKLATSYNGPVTLTSQAGVDTDRYGRHLRYVQYGDDHQDFGEHMVANDHTGVHQGSHDASPDYVARLYALDTMYAVNPPSGRECGDPTPAPAPVTGDGGSSYSYDSDDDHNMPDGALTGGYCARKWWC